MNRTTTLSRLAGLAAGLALAGAAFAADGSKSPEAKPLQAVIGNIRQSRDLKALSYFHGDEQGKFLTGEYWAKATPEQQKEFVKRFHELFGKIAFPKVRRNFEHLATVLYDPPKKDGDRTTVESVVKIDHPVNKQELKLRYWVAQDKAAWKVVDVEVLGDSMLKSIRDDQVIPLLKEGGWDKLLKAMRDKLAEKELADAKLK
jgi:phospholipid transport system substrate-binding protein